MMFARSESKVERRGRYLESPTHLAGELSRGRILDENRGVMRQEMRETKIELRALTQTV